MLPVHQSVPGDGLAATVHVEYAATDAGKEEGSPDRIVTVGVDTPPCKQGLPEGLNQYGVDKSSPGGDGTTPGNGPPARMHAERAATIKAAEDVFPGSISEVGADMPPCERHLP